MDDQYGIQLSAAGNNSSISRSGLIARSRRDASRLLPISPVRLMDFDFLVLDFDRDDVEVGDTTQILGILLMLLEIGAAEKFCERVDVCCTGYESDSRDLWEIPQVRAFVRKLDAHFPYWCYFLSRNGEGLMWLTYCMYPLAMTQAEKQRLWLPTIPKYLENRGLPHMNVICRLVQCSSEKIMYLTKSAVQYLTLKPLGKYGIAEKSRKLWPSSSDVITTRQQSDAQYSTGISYCYGESSSTGYGIPHDYSLARIWLLLAAEKGHGDAQFALGVLYDQGLGIPEDSISAAGWYQKAARQGHVDAKYNLGIMSTQGRGIPKDFEQAGMLLKDAANLGHAAAQFTLGRLYMSGLGLPQDYIEAYFWFEIAAAFASPADKQEYLAVRDAASGSLTSEDIVDQRARAALWLRRQVQSF